MFDVLNFLACVYKTYDLDLDGRITTDNTGVKFHFHGVTIWIAGLRQMYLTCNLTLALTSSRMGQDQDTAMS